MPGVGSAWPTEPGTTVGGWAASGLPGFCAVPAGGVAVVAAAGALGAGAVWLMAAAGVSPAAAKAIAHPISLIFTPGWNRRAAGLRLRNIRPYKHGFPEPQAGLGPGVEGTWRTA